MDLRDAAFIQPEYLANLPHGVFVLVVHEHNLSRPVGKLVDREHDDLPSFKAGLKRIGPSLGWSHGRFWLSAAFGVGVYQIKTAPRVVWGVLF